jgi:phage terminase large subunit
MKLSFNTHGNEKQKDCCRAWVNPEITDIYYGGAKGGAKSFTLASLTFADALTYPDTRYFIARKKLNDLRKFTVPTIDKVFTNWGIKQKDYAKFNGSDNFYQCYNGSKILFLEAAYMPSDPLYERFGSMEFTRGSIEEAGEFESAAKNNLAASIGRWKNDKYNLTRKLLQTGNPSKNYTYRDYYIPFREGKLKPHQVFIQAFIQDNKMIDKGYIEQLEQSLSKNEKERLLYGNWEYDDDPASLIQYDKILDVFTNIHVEHGRKCITCDVARLGGDKIVIIEWDGWRGFVRQYQKQLLDITGAKLEEIRYRLGIGNSDVLVDEDGMGGGVVDFLKFKGFVNNSSALPAPIGPVDDKGKPIRENFDNLKSQCYFRIAERINKNNLYLQCESEEVKQWIIEELEQVKQKSLDSDMKKGVIPKDKVKELIGRSPDFADTIMMREWFELKPKKEWSYA